MSILAICIGIDPIFFKIGSFEVGWHGVIVVLAVIVAIGLSIWFVKGTGVKKEVIYGVAPWAIIGGIIGARLFHVIDYLASTYISNPMQILQFWYGLSIFGAILGGTLAVVIYARISNLHFGHFADAVAPAVILAQAVGRIGCTINGDAWGAPTSLPWAFVYNHPNAAATTLFWGEPTHPSPVYEIIWDLIVFAVLWRLRGRLKPDGSLFLLYLSLYSFGRFFIEFTRAVTLAQVNLGGVLHTPHFIALLVMAICIALLVYRMRKARAVGEPSVVEET
ncbi:MAG: prolipoprotein diacylglyceryl transferase [Dehalococcoidia bacterium]